MSHGLLKLAAGAIVVGVLLIFLRQRIRAKLLAKWPGLGASKIIFAGAVFCWLVAFTSLVVRTWTHTRHIERGIYRAMAVLGRSRRAAPMPPPEPAAIPPAMTAAGSDNKVATNATVTPPPQTSAAATAPAWEPPPPPVVPVGNLPISWPAISGAVRYRIYDLGGGHTLSCIDVMSPVLETAETKARVMERDGSDYRCLAIGADGQMLGFPKVSLDK